MTTLAERFQNHVERHRLFDEAGVALLAVSGGPDSIALLDLMVTSRASLGIDLAVAHVDHGISDDSANVADSVRQAARHYGLPVYTESLALGSGTSETAAREARYRVLRSLKNRLGAQYLVTGHHADDQVETVLYRLFRGTGIAGLAGIPAHGPGGLVRPLLPFSKRELQAWLDTRLGGETARRPFSIHRDPSNADPRHDRSWLRVDILPRVRERLGARTDGRVLETAQAAHQDRIAWARVLRILPELDFAASEHYVEVARAPFGRYDKALSGALLRALARELDCHLGLRRTARLLEFVRSGSSGRMLELGQGSEAELVFDRLRVSRGQYPRPTTPTERIVLEEGQTGGTVFGDWEFHWRPEAAGVSARDSSTTWLTGGVGVLRPSRPGDRILPLGGVGRRKVRRVLMEARVSSRDRSSYPVLVRDDEVLWIPGVCRSGRCVPEPGEPALRVDARSRRRSEGPSR